MMIQNILRIAEFNRTMNTVTNSPGMMFANGDMGRIKTSLFSDNKSFEPLYDNSYKINNISKQYDYDPFKEKQLLEPVSDKTYNELSNIFMKYSPKKWSVNDTRNDITRDPNKPGYIHVYDDKNNYRYRVDPPDKFSGYEHIHFFDKYGNALNSNYEVVSKKSKEAHIPIKESDNSLSNEEYKKSLR